MRHAEKQRIIRLYKQETGKTEIDMHDVARFAVLHGHPLPELPDPYDLLARDFSRAAREEIRHDSRTRQPYRANHAYTTGRVGEQITIWIDIDEAPRHTMLKCLQQRREQMVGDAYQLSLDAEHWNLNNPDAEPIQMELDFQFDVDLRKNGPQEETG